MVKLRDFIDELCGDASMSPQDVEALYEMEPFMARIQRTVLTEEKAKQTFSVKAIEALVAQFRIWLLMQVDKRWSETDYNPDHAPKSIDVVASVNWELDA